MPDSERKRILKYKISQKRYSSFAFPRVSRMEMEVKKREAGKGDKKHLVFNLKQKPVVTKSSSDRKQVVVGYCAIKNFKELAKRMQNDRDKFSQCINEFIAMVDEVILNERGMTERFDGNGILFYFDPKTMDRNDVVSRAAIASLKLRYRMNKMNRTWDFYRNDAWMVQIGIDTGWAIIEDVETTESIYCNIKGEVARMARGTGKKAVNSQILITENSYKFPKFDKNRFQINNPFHVQPEGADFMVRVREIVSLTKD